MTTQMDQFENMSIGELRKLTEDYHRLQRENKILKTKYPMAKLEEHNDLDLDKLIKEC